MSSTCPVCSKLLQRYVIEKKKQSYKNKIASLIKSNQFLTELTTEKISFKTEYFEKTSSMAYSSISTNSSGIFVNFEFKKFAEWFFFFDLSAIFISWTVFSKILIDMKKRRNIFQNWLNRREFFFFPFYAHFFSMKPESKHQIETRLFDRVVRNLKAKIDRKHDRKKAHRKAKLILKVLKLSFIVLGTTCP